MNGTKKSSRSLQRKRRLPNSFVANCFSIRFPSVLLCQLKADKADLNDIAHAGCQGVTSRLIIQERAVGAARVLDIPGAIAEPQAGMFRRNKRLADLDRIRWPPPDGRLGIQVKARTWRDLARSAIHHDQVAQNRW